MLHQAHLVVFRLSSRHQLRVLSATRQLYFLLLKVDQDILVWHGVVLSIGALLSLNQLLHLELLLQLLILEHCHSVG